MESKIKAWTFLFLTCTTFLSCQKEIHFNDDPNNGNNNPPPSEDSTSGNAVFSFTGAPDNCAVDSSWGIYAKGVEINNAGFRIQVDVSQTGEYKVSSNEVNGCVFSARGVFNSTGIQAIDLTGDGIPTEAGEFSFLADTSVSPCSFSIKVLEPVPVGTQDYFPLTKGSFWSYEDLTSIGDTMTRTVTDTMSVEENLYSIMHQQNKYTGKI